MNKVDKYAPGVKELIEYTTWNAYECGDRAWSEKLQRAYREDSDALDDAFIDIFRAWAAKHNL